MGDAAIKFPEGNKTIQLGDDKNLKKRLKDTHTEELIIGLCGPIGTDLHYVATQLSNIIKQDYNYDVIVIKLSDFIKRIAGINPIPENTMTYAYMDELITKGNEIRKSKGNSVLAELAINEIIVKREELKKQKNETTFTSNRVCYIIDSIKNHEELDLFRLIYSDLFYFFGVFSNLEIREKNLENKGLQKAEIHSLIDRDSGEELDHGQKVADTFVQSDFFLRLDMSTAGSLKHRIERYLNLIFNAEIVTPTFHETAMYHAFAAAGNSACLSRQVGASITNKTGDIISVGWNDVPKYGGSLYMYNENDALGNKDMRCLNLKGGVCFNDIEKDIIRTKLVETLIKVGVVKQDDSEKAIDVIKKSRIKELIEFSRAVHAEMHALISGSQKSGSSVIGGNLYCTTYPCHNCARHIVASGIKDVYYIEPYRKSLALKLHDDSMSEKEQDDNQKVRILMFDGVSPRRYLEFFKMVPNSRKVNGKKKNINKQDVFPRNTVSLQAIPLLEKEIIKELQTKDLIKI